MSPIEARSNGLLTEESRKALVRLLGQDVRAMYTSKVHVYRNYLIIYDISFIRPTKISSEKFVIVRPVWEEDRKGNDYGWLDIIISGTPEKIKYEHGSPMQPGSIGLCSTIDLEPASPINRITLFSKNLWSAEESWIYHFAILVEHKERLKYLISYRPDAFCWLRFTFDDGEIETVLKSAENKEIFE